MNLSNLILSLNYSGFKGLCKLGIEKKFHNINMFIEIYEISFPTNDVKLNEQIMDNIIKKCFDYPYDSDNIFTAVQCGLKKRKEFSFPEIEDIDDNLKFIDDLNDPKMKSIIVEFSEFKLLFDYRQLKRLRRFINSFLYNYTTLNDTIKFFINNFNKTEEPKIEEVIKLSDLNKNENKELINNEIEIESNNDDIHSINEILKWIDKKFIISNLIQLVINYYRYYRNISLINNDDKKIKIKFSNIFTSNNTINREYYLEFMKLIENEVSIDAAKFTINTCFSYIQNNIDQINSLKLQIINYIILLNVIRLAFDSHKNWMDANIIKLIKDGNLQNKLLNSFLKKICNIDYDVYEYVELKNNENEEFTEEIEKIINRRKYLRNVSQNEFFDAVYEDINNINKRQKDIGFKINSKKIINIDEYVDSTTSIDYLKYTRFGNNELKTNLYVGFFNYLKDPSSVLMINTKEIPQVIIKLFETFKNILNNKNFDKDDNSLFSYYLILKEHIKFDMEFKYYLFIIFQLIIPYQYNINKIKNFEDVFLY